MTTLESLPDDWELKSITEIGKIYSGATPSTNIHTFWNGDIVWITPNDLSSIRTRLIESSERKITAQGLKSCSANLLPSNSLVISSRAPIGYLALPTTDFCTNQGCKSIVFGDDQEPEFHYYNFSFRIRQIKEKGEGTTFAEISKTALGQIKFPVPKDKRTQRKIAEVLTAVDHTITQTEALIAKYQRIKTGLMQDLLTRGIDENGNLRHPATHEFKDVEGYGRFPHDWTLSSVEEEFDLVTGFTLGKHRYPRKNKRKYLRVGNVYRDYIDLNNISELEAEDSEMSNRILKENDLLIVEGHANVEEIGRCGLVPKQAEGLTFQNHLFRLRSIDINPIFAWAWLNSEFARAYWRCNCRTSSGLNTINQSLLKPLPIFVPSSREQQMIVDVVMAQDTQLQVQELQLNKLKKLKAGLMQDLLTGKVSVAPLLDSDREGVAS